MKDDDVMNTSWTKEGCVVFGRCSPNQANKDEVVPCRRCDFFPSFTM